MKKRTIITNNKEIYNKFNMLHFTDEVLLKGVKIGYLRRILNNINKGSNILSYENIGDYIVITKKNNLNFNIYFKE